MDNPVYNSTPPSRTSGGQGPPQADAAGNLKVSLADSSTGVPVSSTDPVQVYNADTYLNIAAASTTVVKSGAGVLSSLIVNTPGTSTATLYDNTAASGTKIGTVTLAAGMNQKYNATFGTGLTIVLSATADITVMYR